MDNIRLNNYTQVNSDVIYLENNSTQVLELLKPYYVDSLYTIRSKAYGITSVIGKNSKNRTIRRQAVNILLGGCNDKDAGVSGTCSESLKLFNHNDFTNSEKDKLRLLLMPSVPYLSNLIQLIGFHGGEEDITLLKSLFTDQKLSPRDKWALHLALARLGDTDMLNQVMARTKGLTLNDDMLYEVAPAMVYIRQQQSINYLFEIIMSDNKNCLSANPDAEATILCAYRVLEYIAPVIKDFPLRVDAGGDLVVDNYPAALTTAREWFRTYKDSYELIKDTY